MHRCLRTRGVFKGVDVIFLHEALAQRLFEGAKIGSAKLEDLRCLLARHEESRLGILVVERLALVHGALCTGIFWFSIETIRELDQSRESTQRRTYTCRSMLAVEGWVGESRCEILAGTFLTRGFGGETG